jgi:hypothetical protein
VNGAFSPCTSVSIRPTNWHFGTETSSRHNHSCITLFVDLEVKRLLFATPGKDAATFKPFTKGPNAHGRCHTGYHGYQHGSVSYPP